MILHRLLVPAADAVIISIDGTDENVVLITAVAETILTAIGGTGVIVATIEAIGEGTVGAATTITLVCSSALATIMAASVIRLEIMDLAIPVVIVSALAADFGMAIGTAMIMGSLAIGHTQAGIFRLGLTGVGTTGITIITMVVTARMFMAAAIIPPLATITTAVAIILLVFCLAVLSGVLSALRLTADITEERGLP
ncbi:MAG: hypothetical protein COB37_03455 [Kordiimonadales bacterium]|nr:MAG: hypothetical protein COB37_03455 [Kordiimonadales bacterium]